MEFNYQQQPGLSLHRKKLVTDGAPLVSIITPFYNGTRYFEQTFNCVMNQTFPWFEWIIVNDGSTDPGAADFLAEYAKKDPRIRVLHKENGGISSARNLGIKNSVTDLILPLDCDDLIDPTFVEVCWWMLEKHPDAAWSYTDSVGFQGQEYLWSHRFNSQQEKTENLLTATALIRKSWLEKIGCYDDTKKHYNEDWIAWLKIMALGGYPVQATNEFLFWYRRTDSGVLTKVKEDPAIARQNKAMLEEAAAKIKQDVEPIIYPDSMHYIYEMPVLSQWDRPCYASKNKLRVAFLIPWTVMGGADKFDLDLIAGLDKNKFDVGVLTTLRSDNAWGQRFRAVCDDVFNLPNFMSATDYAEFISYYIKSRQLDVLVVSNTFVGIYLVPWLRQNFPDLAIVDYVHMEEWYWRKGGHARTSGLMGGVLDRTYVCNSATRDVMIDHFHRQPESVETVHIGVDEVYFDRRDIPAGQLYEKMGISSDRPIVLFICRLHPQKRPYLMLEIADRLRARVPDVAFAVVGDGELRSGMTARVKKLRLEDTVYFLGAQKDVRPYYRDAKATLVCSLKEGLSLTAYESCAMGVPIVSADVGGQRDLVDSTVGALVPCLQDEESGLTDLNYSDAEVNSYVEPLARILTDADLWQQMSQTARARIEESFTIHHMVEYFEEEFRRLVQDETCIAARHTKAQALACVGPLAAETYDLLMMTESLTSELDWAIAHPRTLPINAPEGLWRWFRKKFRGMLRHLRQEGFVFTFRLLRDKISYRLHG